MAAKNSNGSTATASRAASPPEAESAAPEVHAAPAAEPEEQTAPPDQMASKRRMPENLRKYLLRLQGGKYYLPAAYRIVWFRDEYPDWTIETELVEGGQEAGFATVKATVRNEEGRVIATGHKTETRQDFPAGWVEKSETGACARALSLAGFGTQFSPELDDEGYRPADSPQPIGGASFGGRPERPSYARGTSAVREEGDRREPAGAAAAPAATAVAAGEVWEGPGQCPRCHAPAGRKHARPCV